MIEQLYDGYPVRLAHQFKIRCCDCGLTHTYRIKPLSNGIRLTVWRSRVRTTQNRKLKKYQHVRKVKWPKPRPELRR